VIADQTSNTVAQRTGLERVKELLRGGDTLVVWWLDRLSRSLHDLIEWVRYLDVNRASGCKVSDRRMHAEGS